MIATFKSGIWENNPVIRGAIGLCPLVAVSNSVGEAVILGGLSTLVLSLSMMIISAFRYILIEKTRLIFFVAIIASFTLLVELVLQAFFYEWFVLLGIYVPLIITNCILLARAESFAQRNGIMSALVDGLGFGIGFWLIIVGLAIVRTMLASNMGKEMIFFQMPLASLFVLAIFFVVINFFKNKNEFLSSNTKSA